MPGVFSVRRQTELNREQVGKAPHCNWVRGPLYPWHRLDTSRIQKDLWAFSVATVNTEKIKALSTLLGLSEDPFIAGLLRVE